MRHPILILALTSVLACSSGGTTVVPPPPPPPPSAAATTLMVQSGDNQSGEPGRPLPATISVIARDAAGQGVAGAVVAFAVDSGGGTVASAQVTTGADGVAAVVWTLGAGPNVVIASVGTLPPVRFRAQGRFGATRTLINGQVVGAGGGTLRYTQPGDALSGLEIKVAADAYPGSTTWTVSADSTVPVSLPADFSQVGPVLVIGNEQGYAASLIALTVPMRLSAADAVAPFFFDAATGILEGVPLLARSDSTITFASRHFSGSLMAIPGSAPGPSGLKSAFRAFGTIKMVFIRIPLSKLIGTFTSSFRPGQDDWEFSNHGDFQSPFGMCEGMTATSLYYHYFFRSAGAPQLFGRFDRFLTNNWDNVRGIHLAGAIQADYSSLIPIMKSQQDAIRDVAAKNGETAEALAATWILLNLKLNQRPLLVGVNGPAGDHAIVAYEATATAGSVVVGIADPNQPGVARTLTFQGGIMVPLPFRTIATGPANNFIRATVFGVTTEIPLTNFHSRWAEFLAGTPGEDRLPNPRPFEVYDSVSATWSALPDTVRLVADTLMLRMRCPSCAIRFTSAIAGPDLIQLEILDPPGTTQYAQGIFPRVAVVEGEHQVFVLAKAFHGGPGTSFLDGRLFTVIKGKLRLFPQFLAGKPDTAYTFTLTHGGLAKPDSRFVWDFGDGTPLQTVIGDSIRTHVYTALGNYTVTVEMRDGSNHLVGRTTSLVTISEVSPAYAAWKFTSASVAFSTVNNPQFFSDSRWRIDSARMARIGAGGSQAGIRLVEQAFTPTGFPPRTAPEGLYLLEGVSITKATLADAVTENGFAVYGFPGAGSTMPPTLPPAPMVNGWLLVQQLPVPVNPLCHVQLDAFQRTGTATNGHVTGLRVPICMQNALEPFIEGQPLVSMGADVNFAGTSATGTISVIYYFYPNSGTTADIQQRIARLTFAATRVTQ